MIDETFEAMMHPSRVGPLLAVTLLSSCLGCGHKPPADPNRATVSGSVTFGGEPLPAGTMTFDSLDKGIGTSISIREGGHFSTDRVPIGANIVTIETEMLRYGSPQLYVRIPAKYADPTKSGLTADVKPGDNPDVNFELKP
jgi:hypothetical protein